MTKTTFYYFLEMFAVSQNKLQWYYSLVCYYSFFCLLIRYTFFAATLFYLFFCQRMITTYMYMSTKL